MVCNFAITPFDGKLQILQMSPSHFCASYYRFGYFQILRVDFQTVGQGHGVQLSPLHHFMENIKI